jgi:hypothetical protein
VNKEDCLAAYIGEPAALLRQASRVTMPNRTQLRDAARVLAQSPVQGQQGFTRQEVRVLAAYRSQFAAKTSADPIWEAIYQGQPEAWLYAVHEASEIEAFQAMGVNPFDWAQWRLHFLEAHEKEVIAENAFLLAWAKQLGYTTSEMALEMANPLRRPLLGQLSRLQRRTGWPDPSVSELEQARQFFRRVL